MDTYATAADYAAFLHQDYPGDWDDAEIARIDAGLEGAQRDIDDAIYFSRYDSDDTTIQAGLTEATCCRFQYMEGTGDDGTGSFGLFDSVGIGSVRLSRQSGNAQTSAADSDPLATKLGPRAAMVLRRLGMISGLVYES